MPLGTVIDLNQFIEAGGVEFAGRSKAPTAVLERARDDCGFSPAARGSRYFDEPERNRTRSDDKRWGLVLEREALGDRADEIRSDAGRGGGVAVGHLAGQFGDGVDRLERLAFGDDTLLDEHMQHGLAKHQGHAALRIRHWSFYRSKRFTGSYISS
jgi:hypothetical protein